MKEHCIFCCHDTNTYNLGRKITYYGMIIAAIGSIAALIGNRVSFNCFENKVICGTQDIVTDFNEIIMEIEKD